MSIPSNISAYLDKNSVEYSHILHPKSYSAEETAHKVHCQKHEMAKILAVHLDRGDFLIIIPANERLDMKLVRKSLHTKKVRLFSEKEMLRLFADCEVGAMPAFGNLYNLPVIAAHSLLEDGHVYFNAGTHTDAIKCSISEFIKHSHPLFATVSKLNKDNFVCRELSY